MGSRVALAAAAFVLAAAPWWQAPPLSQEASLAPLFSGLAQTSTAETGPTPNDDLAFGEMKVPRWLAETVVRAAQATNVDPAYMMALADKESSLLPDNKARTSSAEGLSSRPFRQDALVRVSPIADPRATPMARPHGREPVAVEAADPGRDGLGVPSSDLVGSRRVARAIRNRQERSGALDLRGGRAERAAQAGQLLALIRRERAKGICPVARHGTPGGTRITAPLYQFQGQMTH